MISAVINTLNNEKTLVPCLKSLVWVDEIVVVDLGSTDKTLTIAKKAGAKIFSHPKVDYVELVRNFSLEKASGDWILVVDPDEEIPEKLKRVLGKIAKRNRIEALRIPRKNFIFGKFIRHTNFWPDFKLRFFKKDKTHWPGQIHVDAQARGEIFDLPAKEDLAIIHYAYNNLAEFLTRLNRYTTAQAQEKFGWQEKFKIQMLFLAPLGEFLRRFVKGLGFLDGTHGVVLTILQMFSQFLVWGKLWEREKGRGGRG